MLDLVQKYLCLGTAKERSASAAALEKKKTLDRYICPKCQKDFLSLELYELHQKTHTPSLNSTSGLSDSTIKKEPKLKESSNDLSVDSRTRDDTGTDKNSKDKEKMDRSQIYMHGGDKPLTSVSSSSIRGIPSQSSLEKRRGSIGTSQMGCSEAPKSNKQSNKADSEAQSVTSIGSDPIDVIVSDLLSKSRDARREGEIRFIQENIHLKSATKYVVSNTWIRQYMEYLNGDRKSPPGAINNEQYRNVSATVSKTQTIFEFNETLWRFMQKMYGGGPEVPNNTLSYSRSASDSDKSEPQTADTMSRSEANESLRTSGGDSRASKKKENIYLRAMGMENDSFYCYMNACLQGLLSIGDLIVYVYDEKYKKVEHKKSQKAWKALNEVISLHAGRGSYCTPRAIRRIAMDIFDPDEQHDAHEFLRFLLSAMQDEVNLARPKKEVEFKEADMAWAYYRKYNVSLIDELFAGQLINQVTCCMCKHVSTTFDPFLDLSLPIIVGKTHTIDDCLEAFQKEEEIKDSYTCEKCKSKAKVLKRLVVNKFPKYLVVHLKRFQLFPRKKKITEHITFPIDNWNVKKVHNKEVCSYSLIANIVHRGSFDAGHYISYIKRDDWLLCDDEALRTVSTKEVSSREAYVLIYERNN